MSKKIQALSAANKSQLRGIARYLGFDEMAAKFVNFVYNEKPQATVEQVIDKANQLGYYSFKSTSGYIEPLHEKVFHSPFHITTIDGKWTFVVDYDSAFKHRGPVQAYIGHWWTFPTVAKACEQTRKVAMDYCDGNSSRAQPTGFGAIADANGVIIGMTNGPHTHVNGMVTICKRAITIADMRLPALSGFPKQRAD